MLLTISYGNFWNYWELYHKVIFDPLLKLVYVTEDVTDLDVQIDLYSDFKEWYKLDDNSKYADFGMRSIGGDPTIAGQKAGDIYFMTNGWRVVYDPTKTAVTGVLFSDDYNTPWLYSENLEPVYPAVVASLVNRATVSLDALDIPSAAQNATAVRTELIPELTLVDASISSRATQTSVNNIQTDVTAIDGKIDIIDVTINNILSVTQEVLKYGKNRSRIDPINYQMIIYEDDNVTELKRYDLKNRDNVASILEIFDKIPVSGSP